MIDYYDDYDDLEEVPSNNQETTANHGGQQPEKEKPQSKCICGVVSVWYVCGQYVYMLCLVCVCGYEEKNPKKGVVEMDGGRCSCT